MVKKGATQHTVILYEAILLKDASKEGEPLMSLALVMNYTRHDLTMILQKRDKIEVTKNHVKQLTYNLLCGLSFIHSAGLMHRDLKPSNVLLKKECRTLLCDFGLARTTPEPAFKMAEELTGCSEIIKTLKNNLEVREKAPRSLSPHVATRFYRAPEVILLSRDYNEKIDLWSLGVTITEVINC